MENKTKTFIISKDKLFTSSLTTGVVLQPTEPPPATAKLRIKKPEIPHKICQLNPYYSFFPKFYKQELFRAFAIAVAWGLVTLASLTFGIVIFAITRGNSSKFSQIGLPLLLAIGIIVVGIFFINYLTKYQLFRDEAKNINFKDERVISVNTIRVYKNAKVGYIKANWICGLVYVASFLAIITTLIISCTLYGFNINGLTTALTLENPELFYTTITVAIAFVIALILHAFIVISNYLRTAVIDNFYNTFIVSNDEITQLKKQINKKYMIIFGISLCVFIWLWSIVYKLFLKRFTNQKSTTIEVK